MLSALRQTVNTELQVTKEVIEGKFYVELQSSQSVIGKIKQKARMDFLCQAVEHNYINNLSSKEDGANR